MKSVTLIDRKGHDKGSVHTLLIPIDTALVEASFGVFGWRATLAKSGAIKIQTYNGKPRVVKKEDKVLWEYPWPWGKNARQDRQAQLAWWQHAKGVEVRVDAQPGNNWEIKRGK